MAYYGKGLTTSKFVVDYFSGDDQTQTFILQRAPGSVNGVFVTFSGVKQQSTEYSITGDQITFHSPPPQGTKNIEVLHLGVESNIRTPAEGTVGPAQLQSNLKDFPSLTTTADGGNTYNLPGVAGSSNSVLAVVGGVTQDPNSDYSLNATGDKIVFNENKTNNETITLTLMGIRSDIGVPSDDSVGEAQLVNEYTDHPMNTFVGDDSTTEFSLPAQAPNANSVLVSVGGVIQQPGTSFSLNSDRTKVQFSTAPANGAEIFMILRGFRSTVAAPGQNTVGAYELQDNSVGLVQLTEDMIPQHHNYIINGAFRINQRGISINTTLSLSDKEYFFDRWRSVGTTSGVQVSSDGTVTVGVNEGIEQVIEYDPQIPIEAGDTVSVSVYNTTADLTVTLLSYDETTGSVTGTITSGGGRQSTILTVPTLDSDGHIVCRIEDASGGGASFSLVQFEKSSIATSFEERNRTTELDMCMRFYEIFGAGIAHVEYATNNKFWCAYRFTQEKRATPAISLESTFKFRYTGSGYSLSGASLGNITVETDKVDFNIQDGNNSGTADGDSIVVQNNVFSAEAEL